MLETAKAEQKGFQRSQDMKSTEGRDSAGEMKKFLDWSDKVLNIITGAMLIFLTLMIVLDVSLRFLFNSPLPASAETTELIMPYIAFGALAYTLGIGSHVRISLLTERTSEKVQRFFEILASLVGFLFCLMLTYKGWLFFWESFVIREEMLAIIKLPWWFGKFSLPLGFFFMTLRFLFNLYLASTGRLRLMITKW
jgi:TRAP-type C4-dicarboxylate transport system permease small subunit